MSFHDFLKEEQNIESQIIEMSNLQSNPDSHAAIVFFAQCNARIYIYAFGRQ